MKSKVYLRYLYVTLIALLWMLFFDGNSLFFYLDIKSKEDVLYAQEKSIRRLVSEKKTLLREIKENKDFLEKIAREKYNMRRGDEDVYLIFNRKS